MVLRDNWCCDEFCAAMSSVLYIDFTHQLQTLTSNPVPGSPGTERHSAVEVLAILANTGINSFGFVAAALALSVAFPLDLPAVISE